MARRRHEGTQRDERTLETESRTPEAGGGNPSTSSEREEGAEGKEIQQGKPMGEVVVEIPVQEETGKKRRGRPPGSVKKSETSSSDMEAQATALVLGLSELISIVAGQHWKYSPEEAELVGRPLGRILVKYVSVESLSKYSDAFALFTGIVVTAVPRIVISKQMKKAKVEKHEPKPSERTQNENTAVKQGNADKNSNVVNLLSPIEVLPG